MTSHHSRRGPRFPWRAVPGIRAMSSYRREWLVKDLVAGVVPTMLPVPQGMAYAELAGLLIGQLPKLLGFMVEADDLVGECVGLVRKLADGAAVPAAGADPDTGAEAGPPDGGR